MSDSFSFKPFPDVPVVVCNRNRFHAHYAIFDHPAIAIFHPRIVGSPEIGKHPTAKSRSYMVRLMLSFTDSIEPECENETDNAHEKQQGTEFGKNGSVFFISKERGGDKKVDATYQ